MAPGTLTFYVSLLKFLAPMPKLSIDDLDLRGKRVLVRVDFNVPLDTDAAGHTTVSDDTRIRAALPTIRKITGDGGKAILMSHLGRPKGAPDPKYSLRPVADHLATLLDQPVAFSEEAVGSTAEDQIARMTDGGVLLLENTRFYAGETANDPGFAEQLARLGDVYVNDAFGSAHRAHASTEGVTHYIHASAMGYLLAREVNYLSRVLESPASPFVAVLGGAKVSDKIGIIEKLLEKADYVLIGGAMSYTFLKALGHGVGTSLVEEDKLEQAMTLHQRADGKIILPKDHVVAEAFSADAPHQTVEGDIPDNRMGLDIGPATVEAYREKLLDARTIVWNGPMGVFEMAPFAKGTFSIAQALADATDEGTLSVVGGGDSVAAITQAGFEDDVSHVSTGGGAMLEFLEGKALPGVVALTDA